MNELKTKETKHNRLIEEFDFFMDEDVRNRRIGILCLEKRLTPALTDLLLGVTTFLMKKKSETSFAKKQVVQKFSKLNDKHSKIALEKGIYLIDS